MANYSVGATPASGDTSYQAYLAYLQQAQQGQNPYSQATANTSYNPYQSMASSPSISDILAGSSLKDDVMFQQMLKTNPMFTSATAINPATGATTNPTVPAGGYNPYQSQSTTSFSDILSGSALKDDVMFQQMIKTNPMFSSANNSIQQSGANPQLTSQTSQYQQQYPQNPQSQYRGLLYTA